jgi:hypothetical protein
MIKSANIKIHGVGKGSEIKPDQTEDLFNKIMTENFTNLGKDMCIQVHRAFRIPNRHVQRRTSLSYTIVQIPRIKNKERILKAMI